MITDEATVVRAVRGHLLTRHPCGVDLAVVEDGVRQIDGWWRVPVLPSKEPSSTFEYYDALAEVEGELQDVEHLDVLLVPDWPADQTDAAGTASRG